VTLEVFGESSMGPLTEQMKKDQMERQGDIKFNIVWNTLGGYLDHLVARGISTNVASFVSAATVRANESDSTIARQRRGARADAAHVRFAMDEGAMGTDDGADLHPRRVCKDRRARRAREGGIGLRRHVHLAHAQRGDRLLEAIDER
jgi:N-acyl-D-amino-acid deacylase